MTSPIQHDQSPGTFLTVTMRVLLALLFLASVWAITAKPQPKETRVRACFYHNKYTGRLTANGDVYDPHKLTAASLTLPLGTILLVRNVHTGQTVRVLVNDRGPYTDKYALDLSEHAARTLGITKQAGWGTVSYQILKLGDNKYRRASDCGD